MKTLILKNGTAVDFIECYSNNQYIQGAQREVLDFRFDPAVITMDAVDQLLTSDECSRMTIREVSTVQVETLDEQGNPVVDEAGEPVMQNEERVAEFVHDDFGIRVALTKQHFTVATANGAEDVEQISVKVAKLTYTEKQVASLTETVDVLVLESLMG